MNAVVDGYDQLAAGEKRRFMMWNMENIDAIATEQARNSPVIGPETLPFRLVQLLKIGWPWPKFMQMTARAEQKIFVARVERSNVADEVPDIRPNSEFIDLPNINRDSHSHSTPSIIGLC